jgi:fatty-acyl-CoA synthase
VWAGPLGYREPALFGHFWRIVEHYRIAAMSAVPTVYATLAQVPVDAHIGSLRVAMVGASPLPAAVRDAFQAHTGVRLLEGYGLTEATCASARSFPDAPRPGSAGQRLPYQRVRIVHIESDGQWLDTGDLARLDEDGFIYLTGRAKDLIIRGGHNIDPAIIEDALLAHPQVTAAAAVGRPDVHAGEVPVAYVTLAPEATVTGDQLRDFAADRVAERAAAPKAVTVLDPLPVTAVGKPYKLALRADATRRAVADALAGFPGTQVGTAIDDGSVVTTVTVADDTNTPAVAAVLNQYALRWHLNKPATDSVPVSD